MKQRKRIYYNAEQRATLSYVFLKERMVSNFINEDFMIFLNKNKLIGSVVVFLCCMGVFSILDKLSIGQVGDSITTLAIHACLSLVFTISVLPKRQE